MRAIMVAVIASVRRQRHGARRERKIEPDSDKQPEGGTAPGSAPAAAKEMAQVVVSNTVSAIRLVILPAEVKDRCHAAQNINWIESWFDPTDDSQSLLSSQT